MSFSTSQTKRLQSKERVNSLYYLYVLLKYAAIKENGNQ